MANHTASKNEKLTNVKYVKQSWPITSIAKELTLQETHIFAELMDQIGDRVSSLLTTTPIEDETGKHLYLFKDEDFDDLGMTYINLDLSFLTSRTDCYKNVQKVVEKLKTQNIKFNEASDEKILEHNMNIFADVIVEKDLYGRRTGILKLAVSKYQARYFFDFARWSKYIKEIVGTCKSVHTARLYMLLSANKEYDWIVPYKKLRDILGCSIYNEATGTYIEKYTPFKNFKFKVLDIARDEMRKDEYKGVIDFTFDYEPIYAPGVKPSLSNDPDKIKFIVTKTHCGLLETEKNELPTEYIDLQNYIINTFSLTTPDIVPIINKVHNMNILEQFTIRVHEIAESMRKQGERIKQKKAYARKALYAAIDEFINKDPEFLTPVEEFAEADTYTLHDTDKEWWNGVVTHFADTPTATPLEGMQLMRTKNGLHIEVPTLSFLATFRKEVEEVKEYTKLNIVIKK